MNVFISVDLEGIGGIVHRAETRCDDPGSPEVARAQMLMTEEVNAAVRGAFAAGATGVLVNDAHGDMRNLLPDALDPRARLVRGAIKPLCMMEGVDRGCDAAIMLGAHARLGGSERGVLNHTLSGALLDGLWLNGDPVGEIQLNAALAGHFGAPIVFVAGDEAACDEARGLLGEDLEVFATKEGIDRTAAICHSPDVCRSGITAGVIAGLGASRAPFVVPAPLSIRCAWHSTTAAAACGWIPSVDLVSPRVTEFTAVDAPDAMRVILVQLLLAQQAVTI